ncbi:MAG: hypothetical protein ACLSAP_12100 [Oscillospiraceae bacterium]
MFLDCKQLFEVEGTILPFEYEVSPGDAGLLSDPHCRSIQIAGSARNNAGIVSLRFTASLCPACVRQMSLPDFPAERRTFAHALVQKLENGDSDLGDQYVVVETAVWLDELALADMFVPASIFMQRDYPGLCPACGKNLNDGDCGCKAARNGSSPWCIKATAGLAFL